MAKLREVRGSYVLDWYDTKGVRHRDNLGRVGVLSLREARRLEKRKQLETAAGYQALNPAPCLAFSEWAGRYVSISELEHPDSVYRVRQIVEQHLLPAFGKLSLDAIRPTLVDEYKRVRLRHVKPTTVGKEIRTLKAMLNRAVAQEEILRNPIAHVTEPRSLNSKPPTFYQRDELEGLYLASPYHWPVWKLLANSGLRRTEFLQLGWRDVKPDTLVVLSVDDESGRRRTKSGKWREVPLTDGAREALDALRLATGKAQFVAPSIRPESLSRAAIKCAQRAGLDGSIHTLRHTYISHLVMAGVPLRTVQVLAGHSTIAVTERYAHLTPSHLRSAGTSISL